MLIDKEIKQNRGITEKEDTLSKWKGVYQNRKGTLHDSRFIWRNHLFHAVKLIVSLGETESSTG